MKYSISNFTQMRPVGYPLIQAERQIEKQTEGRKGSTRLIGAFRDYSKAPESAILWDVHPCSVIERHLHFSDTTSRVEDKFLFLRRKQ
jgi:hypothetical protein